MAPRTQQILCRCLVCVVISSYRLRLCALHYLAGSLHQHRLHLLAGMPLRSAKQLVHTALTLSGWRVRALHHRPNVVGLSWALLHRPGNIGVAGALIVSFGIIGLAHLPDIIGLTGALLLRPDFIGLAAGALFHRPGLQYIGRLLGSRTIEHARRPFTALSAVAYMYVERQ
jgi:hypothetical protein